MSIEDKQRARCLSLFSGGLDSQLSVCVLREQGIDVHGIVFDSPFFNADLARRAAERLELALHIIAFSADIVELLADPPHGFGSCMNPCIDCHGRMLRRAGELMEDMGFDFLSTGEVLNQRPMSQNRDALQTVLDESGYADSIVRPLSAGLLGESGPEREGLVDRSRLLSLEGRGRKAQFKLAEKYGLTDIPSPAGGCRLTEPNFCKRLKDLQEHEGLDGLRSIELLRFGRHFRLDQGIKIIVGRNESDNATLEGYAELYDLVLKAEQVPGPTCLLPFTATEDQVRTGAAICARYSDHRNGNMITIKVRSPRGVRRVEVQPMKADRVEGLRL